MANGTGTLPMYGVYFGFVQWIIASISEARVILDQQTVAL